MAGYGRERVAMTVEQIMILYLSLFIIAFSLAGMLVLCDERG